jgi:VWFA-related protein
MHYLRHAHRYRDRTLAALAALLLAGTLAHSQAAAEAGDTPAAETAEVTSQDSQPSLQLRIQRNEVVVRVVVRDSRSHFVTNLKQDDFRIFDDGKPQVITHFAVEGAEAAPAAASAIPGSEAAKGAAAPPAPEIVLPRRFLALYFDDVHLDLGDLMVARNAAASYLASTLKPGDRAAIYTASGQNQVDFTDDRQQLHEDLMQLIPRPILKPDPGECPDISPYQAYKMVDEHDQYALQIAYEEAFECQCTRFDDSAAQQMCRTQVQSLADSMAARTLDFGLNESEFVLRGLELICRRMARLPGQRAIVLVSPGFLSRSKEFAIDRIVDVALRQNIVISTLDARGLYVEQPLGDVTQNRPAPIERPDLVGWKNQFGIEEARTNADVLEEFARETGGVYFHNSNDIGEGFRRTGTFPQTFFMLAFAPQNLKLNGRLHNLKVTLVNNPGHYNLEFRRGYYAPDKAEDAATVAREELAQMVYSQEEVHTIPIEIHTQFFKAGANNAKLSVVTHVDIGGAKFRKSDGRNFDHMVLMTAIFDRSGNYVTGQEKTIQFRLFDATLTRLLHTGLNVKATLPVKPGTYLVREVVNDSGSDQMSALNSTVEIPE